MQRTMFFQPCQYESTQKFKISHKSQTNPMCKIWMVSVIDPASAGNQELLQSLLVRASQIEKRCDDSWLKDLRTKFDPTTRLPFKEWCHWHGKECANEKKLPMYTTYMAIFSCLTISNILFCNFLILAGWVMLCLILVAVLRKLPRSLFFSVKFLFCIPTFPTCSHIFLHFPGCWNGFHAWETYEKVVMQRRADVGACPPEMLTR